MKYKCLSIGIQGVPYTVKADISEVEYRVLKQRLDFILGLSNEMDYWDLLDYNVAQLESVFSRAGCGQENSFRDLNGNFSNVLSSYYLWKCYNKHHGGEKFEQLLQEARSNHVECYLFSELRNYLAHNGFVINTIRFDVIKEITSFYIDPQLLWEYADRKKNPSNARYKQYLQQLVENQREIEVQELMRVFGIIYPEIQKAYWKTLEPKTKQCLELLFSVVPRDEPDLYNSNIVSDDRKDYFGIGQPLSRFVEKAAKLYPQFLE